MFNTYKIISDYGKLKIVGKTSCPPALIKGEGDSGFPGKPRCSLGAQRGVRQEALYLSLCF